MFRILTLGELHDIKFVRPTCWKLPGVSPLIINPLNLCPRASGVGSIETGTQKNYNENKCSQLVKHNSSVSSFSLLNMSD